MNQEPQRPTVPPKLRELVAMPPNGVERIIQPEEHVARSRAHLIGLDVGGAVRPSDAVVTLLTFRRDETDVPLRPALRNLFLKSEGERTHNALDASSRIVVTNNGKIDKYPSSTPQPFRCVTLGAIVGGIVRSSSGGRRASAAAAGSANARRTPKKGLFDLVGKKFQKCSHSLVNINGVCPSVATRERVLNHRLCASCASGHRELGQNRDRTSDDLREERRTAGNAF